MEFNFLNNMFANSYPSMSPLISPHQVTDPFIQEDNDEDSYYSPKEIYGLMEEKINDSKNKQIFPEKLEKENL
jgi:hypothetical protein